MKHYSHIALLLAICTLIWPLQSCANGPSKPAAPSSEIAETTETAESSESPDYSEYSDYSDNSENSDPSDAKKPGYRILLETLLKEASQKPANTCFPLFFPESRNRQSGVV